MGIRITARHFTASEKLQEFASGRLEKLSRYHKGISDMHLLLQNGEDAANSKIAELKLTTHRRQFMASAEASSFETAINECTAQVKRQLVNAKDKIRSKHRVPKHLSDAPTEPETSIEEEF